MDTCFVFMEECEGEDCLDAMIDSVACMEEEEEWEYADGEFEPYSDSLLTTLTECIESCFMEDDAFSSVFEDFQDCMLTCDDPGEWDCEGEGEDEEEEEDYDDDSDDDGDNDHANTMTFASLIFTVLCVIFAW